jgi:hypothetical protein
MFFELRQYVVRPGKQAEWVKCMEEEIIPFQVKMGMVILGSFVGEEDQSVYVWIRRFENEGSASASTMPSTRATTGRTRSAPRSAG